MKAASLLGAVLLAGSVFADDHPDMSAMGQPPNPHTSGKELVRHAAPPTAPAPSLRHAHRPRAPLVLHNRSLWDPQSPKELKALHKEMKKIVKKLDESGDGLLTLAEIKNHMNAGIRNRIASDDKRIIAQGKQKVPKEMKAKDVDGDGLLSQDEVFAHADHNDLDGFEQHKLGVFQVADRNGDGKLNADEYLVYLHPEMSEHKDEYNTMVAQQHMDKVDGNAGGTKDGVITWEEHWHDVIHGHDFSDAQRQDLDETERELFKKHDEDGNGKLDANELGALLYPDLKTIDFVGPQASHLHGLADEDGDGNLSWEEMKKHAEMLVGGLGGGGGHGEL